jgi:hypothetical protein
VADLEEAYALANEFASEHVQVLTASPRDALAALVNYGALFLGPRTTLAFGDKVIGPTTCCRPATPVACGWAASSRPSPTRRSGTTPPAPCSVKSAAASPRPT